VISFKRFYAITLISLISLITRISKPRARPGKAGARDLQRGD